MRLPLLLSRASLWLVPLVLIVLTASYTYARNNQKIYPTHFPETQIELEDWVVNNTPRHSLFAVPPRVSWFRSRTLRSIVINHKAFPYRDADIYTWFERLGQWAPVELPVRTDNTLISRLDSSYHSLPVDTLVALVSRYDVTHILRDSPLPESHPAFEEVYRNPDWYLYASVKTDEE